MNKNKTNNKKNIYNKQTSQVVVALTMFIN